MVSIFIAEKKHAPQQSLNKRVSGSGFKPSPKLPSANSFIRKTLGDILLGGHRNKCEVRIYYLLDGYKW